MRAPGLAAAADRVGGVATHLDRGRRHARHRLAVVARGRQRGHVAADEHLGVGALTLADVDRVEALVGRDATTAIDPSPSVDRAARPGSPAAHNAVRARTVSPEASRTPYAINRLHACAEVHLDPELAEAGLRHLAELLGEPVQEPHLR